MSIQLFFHDMIKDIIREKIHIGNMKETWVIYIRDLGQSTNCQLVLSWKSRKLVMVLERAQYHGPLIRSGQWLDHLISWWAIECSVPPRSLENKAWFWREYDGLCEINGYTHHYLEGGYWRKDPHQKYERDLSNI